MRMNIRNLILIAIMFINISKLLKKRPKFDNLARIWVQKTDPKPDLFLRVQERLFSGRISIEKGPKNR